MKYLIQQGGDVKKGYCGTHANFSVLKSIADFYPDPDLDGLSLEELAEHSLVSTPDVSAIHREMFSILIKNGADINLGSLNSGIQEFINKIAQKDKVLPTNVSIPKGAAPVVKVNLTALVHR